MIGILTICFGDQQVSFNVGRAPDDLDVFYNRGPWRSWAGILPLDLPEPCRLEYAHSTLGMRSWVEVQ